MSHPTTRTPRYLTGAAAGNGGRVSTLFAGRVDTIALYLTGSRDVNGHRLPDVLAGRVTRRNDTFHVSYPGDLDATGTVTLAVHDCREVWSGTVDNDVERRWVGYHPTMTAAVAAVTGVASCGGAMAGTR